MADAPKDITAALTADSSTRFEERWKEFKRRKDFKTWRDTHPSKTNEPKKALYEALTKFVEAAGGIVTSPPGATALRVEIEKNSDLPGRLQKLGWHVFQLGTNTRVSNAGLIPTDIIEITK